MASEDRPTTFEIDVEKSSVHLVKSKRFLLQTKNALSENIEISFTDVIIRNTQNKIIPFQLEWAGSGKYYLLPVSNEKELEIAIQGKVIGKKSKVNFRKPDKNHSALSVVSRGDHTLLMRLKLADKNNRPIDSDEVPEILVEGEGSIEELKAVENGLWEFNLVYPEHNVIIYLSIRSHESLLDRLYRFQHVEK